MNTYVVTKICRQCSRVAVIPIEKSAKSAGTKKHHYCITGNLPQLYPQMVIGLELENTDVRDCMRMTDYRVELSKRNSEILLKHNVTESEYDEILRKHHSLFCEGLSWEDVQVEIDRVYDKLSFHDADRIHKSVVNNATDNLRLNAINRNFTPTVRHSGQAKSRNIAVYTPTRHFSELMCKHVRILFERSLYTLFLAGYSHLHACTGVHGVVI